uniref:ATP synthase F0 subunit 8 n=1 Tax=Alpheus digitalis TaxID=674293 RepID=E7BLL4_ALPDI|nr:ATP synthase F0 subunit 8 [Alpheus distinguendus]ACV90179.1 ATP synthase F0 subunit 8 [Alpheus distinguendus]
MPQMSPLLWLNLYIMFTITLVIFIAMFFFTKSPSPVSSAAAAPLKKMLNWKW